MRACPIILVIALITAATADSPANAERLVASLSTHRVMITSNFTGEELVLFGGIEQDNPSVPPRSSYDIVVTINGPRQSTVTFRKERMLAIWVNADSRVFEDVPSYVAVLSNRPLAAIASTETLRRLQLGLENISLPQRASVNIAESGSDDPFRQAFIQIKADHGLYREVSNAVTFLAPELFRATIALPAEVLVGTYEVEVRLFSDGAQIARTPRPVRSVQVRVRAGGQHRSARSRGPLRPRYRGDGARHGLVRLGRVPAGLKAQHYSRDCAQSGTSRPGLQQQSTQQMIISPACGRRT